MAVFVWATGAVPVDLIIAPADVVTFTVNNRTTITQVGVAALWNHNTSPKTLNGAVIPVSLAPNTASVFTLTATAASTLAELEVRLPDPHMDVYSNSPELLNSYQPGSFFRDSDPTGTP